MDMKAIWYNGVYSKYQDLPWLHDLATAPKMPWKVIERVPFGYIVFEHSTGKFKVLTTPVVMAGDLIS